MKTLTEKVCKLESALVGGQHTVCRQRFKVEESDVGRDIPHFGGHHYRTLRIAQRDVGKEIEMMTDGTGWQCWGFIA